MSTEMNTAKRVVVLLEREVLTACEVVLSSNTEILVGKKHKISWDKNTLINALEEVKDYFSSSEIDVILGQDLATVVTVRMPHSDKDPLDESVVVAQDLLGTNFASYGIDYTLLETGEADVSYVQLFIVQKRLLSLFGQTVESLKMTVSSIESLGDSLIRSLDSDEASLVLFGESYLYGALQIGGHLLESQQIDVEDNIYNQLKTLLSSYEEKYNIVISTIHMASSKLDKKKLKTTSGKNVEEKDLNPFSGNVSKNDEFSVGSVFEEEVDATPVKDIDLDDDKTRNLSIMDDTSVSAPTPPLKVVKREEEAMESVTTPSSKSNSKLIAIIVTVVVVLIGMVVGGFFVYQNAMNDASNPPEILEVDNSNALPETNQGTPTPESTESASVEDDSEGDTEIDLSEYSVNVLNGSGTPGAAGGVADLLKDAGFEDIDTGNADAYDYDDTVIETKDISNLYESVLTALQDDYSATQGDQLDEDSEYDVVVIVGSN